MLICKIDSYNNGVARNCLLCELDRNICHFVKDINQNGLLNYNSIFGTSFDGKDTIYLSYMQFDQNEYVNNQQSFKLIVLSWNITQSNQI
jgi:hypothetical protein